jgi:hypothetical protein
MIIKNEIKFTDEISEPSWNSFKDFCRIEPENCGSSDGDHGRDPFTVNFTIVIQKFLKKQKHFIHYFCFFRKVFTCFILENVIPVVAGA